MHDANSYLFVHTYLQQRGQGRAGRGWWTRMARASRRLFRPGGVRFIAESLVRVRTLFQVPSRRLKKEKEKKGIKRFPYQSTNHSHCGDCRHRCITHKHGQFDSLTIFGRIGKLMTWERHHQGNVHGPWSSDTEP